MFSAARRDGKGAPDPIQPVVHARQARGGLGVRQGQQTSVSVVAHDVVYSSTSLWVALLKFMALVSKQVAVS